VTDVATEYLLITEDIGKVLGCCLKAEEQRSYSEEWYELTRGRFSAYLWSDCVINRTFHPWPRSKRCACHGSGGEGQALNSYYVRGTVSHIFRYMRRLKNFV
jgi:hypothetical protein